MAWYNIFYKSKKKNMKEWEKYSKDDQRSNPSFYSGSTFIGDWTGADITNKGYGSGFERIGRILRGARS